MTICYNANALWWYSHQKTLLPNDLWKHLVQQEDEEHGLVAVAEEAPGSNDSTLLIYCLHDSSRQRISSVLQTIDREIDCNKAHQQQCSLSAFAWTTGTMHDTTLTLQGVPVLPVAVMQPDRLFVDVDQESGVEAMDTTWTRPIRSFAD